MTTMRSWMLVLALGAVVISAGVTMFGIAADHRDGPIFAQTAINGRSDINDLYVFRSPANPNNTVIVVTVSPFSGVNTPTVFDNENTIDIKVDRNGDAREDKTFRVTFGAPDEGNDQRVTLRVVETGKRLVRGMTNSNLVFHTRRGDGMFRAANHDDPFFFDAVGFGALVNGGAFPRPVGTAANFFGPNVNTLAIILEIPSAFLNDGEDTNIGVWTRLIRGGRQVDRMGFPAINTAVVPPIPRGSNFPIGGTTAQNRQERRNAFNENRAPRNDRTLFGTDAISVLQSFYGRTMADSQGLANFLLPDILPLDTSSNAGFPNGRRLRDDVIDIEVGLLTNNAVTSDNVGDDNGTRITDGNMGTTATFPYLGPPNNPAQGLP